MNINQLYANGRVASISSKLFGLDKFNRLAECASIAEALKVLLENGYANGASLSNANDYEEILQVELDGALSLFSELCLDEYAQKYFLCKYDYLNAKLLMKSKYMRASGVEHCFESTTYDANKLYEAFVRDDYSIVSKNMAEACDAIDAEFASGNRSPRVIDFHLDKAMYKDLSVYAKKSGFKPLRKIYAFLVDTTNLMTLFRLKKANEQSEALPNWFVDGGEISLATLEKLWKNEQAVADLPVDYKAFFELCKDNRPTLYDAEQAQAKYVCRELCDNADLLSVQPVLDYFVKKVAEIEKIRKILVAIKSGQGAEKIKELLK